MKLKGDRNPVLLVHGIIDSSRVFAKMSAYLRNWGWIVHTIDLVPNDGSVCLSLLAQQVKDYINGNFTVAQKLDLVGFSMGGLVSRYYLQRLEGIKKVQRFISISAPNNGTFMAYLLPSLGITQMRPNSNFIQNLNQDAQELLSKLNFSVISTPFDLMILPPTSSKMSIGKEFEIPVLTHHWMKTDERVFKQIHRLLLQPVNNYPEL
jgi:triacylglycerol lipase